jgi:hypothetical protein
LPCPLRQVFKVGSWKVTDIGKDPDGKLSCSATNSDCGCHIWDGKVFFTFSPGF